MSSKEFDVNGTDYKIVLTEQVIGHVNNLKNLYNAAYEDPESFDQVSTEISNTINDIASAVFKVKYTIIPIIKEIFKIDRPTKNVNFLLLSVTIITLYCDFISQIK